MYTERFKYFTIKDWSAAVSFIRNRIAHQPNSIRFRFTPWVRHGRLARSRVRC
jgi:hypothetical protein